jgi:hypothetical protein
MSGVVRREGRVVEPVLFVAMKENEKVRRSVSITEGVQEAGKG